MNRSFAGRHLEPALIAIALYELERQTDFLSWFPTRKRSRRVRSVRSHVARCLKEARARSEDLPSASNEELLLPHLPQVRIDLAIHIDALLKFADKHDL